MERKCNVLFAASEAVPFIKTGGLGDVAGSLPPALQAEGCEVRVMLPKFRSIPEEFRRRMEHVADFRLQLAWRDLYCGIEKLEYRGVTWYFIDNEYYFGRDRAYGYFDDGERMAFFSRAIVESLRYLPDFQCDVLHCHDWHTALAPVYLREYYRGQPWFDRIRTVLTVHNLKFKGQMTDFVLEDILGFSRYSPTAGCLRMDDWSISYLKGGLLYSDVLTTVSPTYAEEIRTPFYGEQLDGIFRQREGVLYGILNGIDTEFYDPRRKDVLAAGFSAEKPGGKAVCKSALQAELGLPVSPETPLIAMVGRLTEQKGLDLLQYGLEELMKNPVQFAILGTGDSWWEEMLKGCAEAWPARMSVQIGFDEAMAVRMYAGADLLLMPSRFEPCGLAQMLAMRYGTLPVVRETGGLKDSVRPFERFGDEGNGFSFPDYDGREMTETVLRAAWVYRDESAAFRKMRKNAMTQDFSWNRAAGQYADLYRSLHPEISAWQTGEKP